MWYDAIVPARRPAGARTDIPGPTAAAREAKTRRTAGRPFSRGVLLWAVLLAPALAPISAARAAPSTSLTARCQQPPSWTAQAVLPKRGEDPLSTCFARGSNHAEALLRVKSNRDYAQLITVTGVKFVFFESSFSASLDARISKQLWRLSADKGRKALLLGPGQSVLLAIARPAPKRIARRVRIQQATRIPAALGQLAWTFLRAAGGSFVSSSIRSCVLARVYATVSFRYGPATALRRMRTCVDHGDDRSHPTSKRRLRRLARRVLGLRRFAVAVNVLAGGDRRLSRIAFVIPGSPRGRYNPKIRLAAANFGTVVSGRRTVEHLRAHGGRPPYRYYIFEEPAMRAPSWLQLAPDGTVIIEPPRGVSVAVHLRVYVVDASGARSLELPAA
jgi:hypothetical protein